MGFPANKEPTHKKRGSRKRVAAKGIFLKWKRKIIAVRAKMIAHREYAEKGRISAAIIPQENATTDEITSHSEVGDRHLDKRHSKVD